MFSRLADRKTLYDSFTDDRLADMPRTDDLSFSSPSALFSSDTQSAQDPALIQSNGNAPIMGTAGNDLLANPGLTDDSLFGLQGADTLFSFGGVDLLFGGDGDDLLQGGDLADWLYGDGDNDSLYGDDGLDVLYAANEAGIADVEATSRNLLIGGAGADMLFGSFGQDTLYGGNDEDFLTGGAGADYLHGGAAADLFLIDLSVSLDLASRFGAADTIADFSLSEGDVLSFGLVSGVVAGPTGTATLVWRGSLVAPNGPMEGFFLPGDDMGPSYLQAWLLVSSPEATAREGWVVIDLDQNGLLGTTDILFRLQSADLQQAQVFQAIDPASFAGWAGDADGDVLEARAVGSRLFGLGGADALLGGNGNDWLSGGDGQDTLAGDAGDDQLWGGAGDDWMLGGNGHDALYAYGPGTAESDDVAAVNRLEGEAGNDSLFGGLGSDWLLGGSSNDVLYGDDGIDSLEGGSGNDTLLGSEGTDSLIGGSGTDSIDGGGGDDTIAHGEASDRLVGGDGFDWIVISTNTSINLGGLENQANSGSWIAQFEAVDARATSGSVTLLGGMEANYLISGSGQDSLNGDAGDDILQAGIGNDSLAGGSGLNIMSGGTGDDRYTVDSLDDLVLEAYAEGNDTVIAAVDFYLPPEVEVLILAPGSDARRGGGGFGNDRLIGNANANQLFGGDGDDTLAGGNGADQLEGGDQNDLLIGGSEADILSGDAGQDSLDGGAENDTLIGGDGADTMAGGAGDDLYWMVETDDVLLEAPALGSDTVITMCDLLLPQNLEFLVVAENISNLSLVGGSKQDIMLGNGLSHFFDGRGGDDLILAGGQSLTDITALFEGWF
jgi:Ca2+-binding RTX toxin-like protein